MIRSQVLLMVTASMLSGWMAHAQGPGMFGPAAPGNENPNPKGIPLPTSPDARFGNGGGVYAPPPLGPDGMPRRPQMPPGYGPMPGPYYPPPMPAPYPPGGPPYGPAMMGTPFAPIPNATHGAMPFAPPMPAPGPYYPSPPRGQPYLVPLEQPSETLPRVQPPPVPHSQPAPTAPVTGAVDATSYVAPAGPFMVQEPYVLYEGGRTQKGLLECAVQSGHCVWLGAEFLYWRMQNSPAPPALATTAPVGAAVVVDGVPIGAIGRADTTVVLGGQSIEPVNRSGARFSIGAWCDPDQTWGIEAIYFILPARGTTTGVSSAGAATDVTLTVPFNNVNPAAPGETSIVLGEINSTINGSAVLFYSSQLQGAELNALRGCVDYYGLKIHCLAGFRWLNLYENLEFSTSQRGILAGQFSNSFDQFQTRNNFFGGQLGLKTDYQYKWFFINAVGKVGYGNMVQTVNIAGQTFTNTGPAFATTIDATVVPGGIFAQPTNIGSYSRNRDAWVAEATVNTGVQVYNWLRLYAGYNFMFIHNVVRPGNQIDRSINATQLTSFTGVPTGPLTGEARPAFFFNESDFWVQGFNLGLEFRY